MVRVNWYDNDNDDKNFDKTVKKYYDSLCKRAGCSKKTW
jgi:hypothetical protein